MSGNNPALQVRLTPEENDLAVKCLRGEILTHVLPTSGILVGCKAVFDLKFKGRTPKFSTLSALGLFGGLFAYFFGKRRCFIEVMRAFPDGVLMQTYKESLRLQMEHLPDGSMVPQESTTLTEPEPFNSQDPDTFVPEFKSPDELDLNQETEREAPVQKQTYEKLRQRNRESAAQTYEEIRQRNREAAARAHEQPHRDKASPPPSKSSEDPRTSTVEIPLKKRVNKYGDIVWDD